jgi:phage/plasmid-like protein (TIGR03299 family)
MAHALEQFEDGTTAFFSAREVAWHKLGTVTTGALSAQEALQTAYLDWQVLKSEKPVGVHLVDDNGKEIDQYISSTDKFMTYRYNPKTLIPEALGVVGSRYTPVQNSEAFSFLNDIADESGAVFETAGSINNGRKVFMTMKMPEGLNVGGIDPINLYLMAWNTHDGSSSFQIMVTPIRVVCQNTLSMAIKQAESNFSWRHTPKVGNKVQLARETLGITFKYVEEFEKEAEKLLAQSMTDKQFTTLIETLVPIDEDSDRTRNLAETARGTLMGLWKAPTQANIANTKWAAYNTIVEYADWAKPVRSTNPDVARAEKIVTGLGDRFKNKALNLIS